MVREIKSRESSKMKATWKMIGARFGAQMDGGLWSGWMVELVLRVVIQHSVDLRPFQWRW